MYLGLPSLRLSPSGSLDNAIRALFASGEQGALYDVSNLSSMYQDSTGVTAAAINSPVGLVLDGKYGYARGGEQAAAAYGVGPASDNLVTSTSASSFTTTAGTTACRVYLNLAGTLGSFYEVIYRVTSVSAGGVQLILRAAAGGNGASVVGQTGGAGTYTVRIGPGASTAPSLLWVDTTAGSTFAVDSISVREIPGAHGVQATSTSRPTIATGDKIDYDAIDDALVATFPVSLGTTCTVGRAVAGVGASILTGQTIGTTYTDNTDHCGLVIVNRALSPGEAVSMTRYLNKKAGV